MPATTAHPTSAALLAYGQGRLQPDEMLAIEGHLAECSTCCEALEATPDDTLMIRAREAATSGFRAREQTIGAKTAPPSEIPAALRDHPRYRVLGLIGHGGMGAVYKAEHRMMERLVALKVINPAFVSSPAALERFEREVKTAAKLSHPNIVAAHDADAAGDLHFLVMEFVEGMSLDRFVASKGPLPPHVAANLIYQAALGLQHAHEKGMIHRDIKPQNLMRTHQGNLKILDFGLARLATQALQSAAADDAVTAPAPERPADATRAGSLLGTPDYIAPEQATDAHQADIRADLYSLGCTLYFLLTGEPPFVGGGMLDKLHAHKTCLPTPIQLRRPEVSNELAAVLDRLLAKNPAERFARPADLAKALKPLAQPRAATTATSELKASVLPSPTVVAEADAAPAPLESLQLDLSATALPIVNKSIPASRQSGAKGEQEVSPLLWIGAAATAVLMIVTCMWLLSGGNDQPVPQQNNGQQLAKQDQQQNNAVVDNSQQNAAQKIEAKKNGATKSPVTPPTTLPRKVLMVVPTRWLFYPDYDLVQKSLARARVPMETAAVSRAPVGYAEGGAGPNNFRPDRALAEIQAADYSAIIFAGYKADELTTPGTEGYAETARLLREFQAAGKPIGALCAGQHVPAAHGLYRGRRITGGQYAEGFPEVTGAGATLTHSKVQVDGRLLTGSLASDGPELVGRLLEMIGR